MNAVVKTEEVESKGFQLPQLSESASVMLMIHRAAADPAIDIEKMERLYELREKMLAREAKGDYLAALAEMQPELPIVDEKGAILNNKGEVQSTYAYWEDINEAILPVLGRHGFALSFRSGRNPDGMPTTTGILSHKGGHSEETTLPLPIDSSGSKNGVQAIASSLSYGKRYTATFLLNLASRDRKKDDDDGQAAGGSEPRQPRSQEGRRPSRRRVWP